MVVTLVSSSVDGVSDCRKITELFADKYEELYTCVSYDEAEMTALRDEIGEFKQFCARV